MKLMTEVPPRALPREKSHLLSMLPRQAFSSGSVRKFQFWPGIKSAAGAAIGILLKSSPSVPASKRRMDQSGFSERRLARTAPAEPAPIIIKS